MRYAGVTFLIPPPAFASQALLRPPPPLVASLAGEADLRTQSNRAILPPNNNNGAGT